MLKSVSAVRWFGAVGICAPLGKDQRRKVTRYNGINSFCRPLSLRYWKIGWGCIALNGGFSEKTLM